MNSCFFLGHRDTSSGISTQLEQTVFSLITNEKVSIFYTGNQGFFDYYAAQAVQKAKAVHPEIRLFLVLSYHPAQHKTTLPSGYDGSYYPLRQSVPPQYAIARAHRKIIHECSFLIAYVHQAGHAQKLLEYAQRREKRGLLRILYL